MVIQCLTSQWAVHHDDLVGMVMKPATRLPNFDLGLKHDAAVDRDFEPMGCVGALCQEARCQRTAGIDGPPLDWHY